MKFKPFALALIVAETCVADSVSELEAKIQETYQKVMLLKLDRAQNNYANLMSLLEKEDYLAAEGVAEKLKQSLKDDNHEILKRIYDDIVRIDTTEIDPAIRNMWQLTTNKGHSVVAKNKTSEVDLTAVLLTKNFGMRTNPISGRNFELRCYTISPNSKRAAIVYGYDRGKDDVYVINCDGSKPRKVLQDAEGSIQNIEWTSNSSFFFSMSKENGLCSKQISINENNSVEKIGEYP